MKFSEYGVALRPMTLEDSHYIVTWRNEDWVRQNYVYREPFTMEGQIRYFHEKIETGKVIQYMVLEKPTGKPIGCTVLNGIDREKGIAEYGMFLGVKEATGKGYSGQMVALTLEKCFQELGLSTVFCRIFTDNVASWKGCERGGFRIDHVIPDVVCTDGETKDMYYLIARKGES